MLRAGIVGLPNVGKSTLFNALTCTRKAEAATSAGSCGVLPGQRRDPGCVHSDFERGFINAETVAYDDLVQCGSVAAARAKGLYRMEGKDYVVADGDVLLFKFNV